MIVVTVSCIYVAVGWWLVRNRAIRLQSAVLNWSRCALYTSEAASVCWCVQSGAVKLELHISAVSCDVRAEGFWNDMPVGRRGAMNENPIVWWRVSGVTGLDVPCFKQTVFTN